MLSAAALSQVHEPEKGSAERKAILDALRIPVERDLKQRVVFNADHFKVSGNWAFVSGSPQTPAGGRPDYSATKFAAAVDSGAFDNNFFGAIPTAAPFQTLFADAGERGQEAFKRTQKAAEELAELTRANIEAMVDAGRIAVEGTRALGQDVVASGREGVEQAASAVRSFAEAKSPTEFLQLQGEFARTSFDRLVAESSKLTESFVKLAGEAIQPISNRASVAAERLNKIVA